MVGTNHMPWGTILTYQQALEAGKDEEDLMVREIRQN